MAFDQQTQELCTTEDQRLLYHSPTVAKPIFECESVKTAAESLPGRIPAECESPIRALVWAIPNAGMWLAMRDTILELQSAAQRHKTILFVAAPHYLIQDYLRYEALCRIDTGESQASWLRDFLYAGPSTSFLVSVPPRRSDTHPGVASAIARHFEIPLHHTGHSLIGGDIILSQNTVFIGNKNYQNMTTASFFGRADCTLLPEPSNGTPHHFLPRAYDLDMWFGHPRHDVCLVSEIATQSTPYMSGAVAVMTEELEESARMLANQGYTVRRIPFDLSTLSSYVNAVIDSPRNVAYVPQYGSHDPLHWIACDVYHNRGFKTESIPINPAVLRFTHGSLRCHTLPVWS